jgi:hypothetical protein
VGAVQGAVKKTGSARTKFICFTYGVGIYNIFGREITKHTVNYGAYTRFWPTLYIKDERYIYTQTHTLLLVHVHYVFAFGLFLIAMYISASVISLCSLMLESIATTHAYKNYTATPSHCFWSWAVITYDFAKGGQLPPKWACFSNVPRVWAPQLGSLKLGITMFFPEHFCLRLPNGGHMLG